MVQIIEENRRPSFKEKIITGIESAMPAFQEFIQKRESYQSRKAEDAQLKQLTGMDFSGINDPEIRQKAVQLALQGKQQEQQYGRELTGQKDILGEKFNRESALQKEKYGFEKEIEGEKILGKKTESEAKEKKELKEKITPFEMGLKTITEMRRLSAKGNLGRGTGFRAAFGGETAKDRGKYEQLGKSIISLASTIPIRNQKEFETLSHNLFDASLPDSEREGILDAMENILKQSIQSYGTEEIGNKTSEKTQGNIIVMKDAEGNIYDIPADYYEYAISKGLKK